MTRPIFFMIRPRVLIAVALLASLATANPNPSLPDPMEPDPNGLRPIDALDTVFLEEMTWMEVRDAMREGKDTVIVATGGMEQNGPYTAAGKHNYVLRGTTEAIARKLGNALVAPIVGFVPEGDIDPPTGHMKYPSTVSITPATYERLLTDICESFRTHGFAHIVLIGDSGGGAQEGLKAVANRLGKAWAGTKTRIDYVPQYYNHQAVDTWLETQGIRAKPEGLHDSLGMTATLMVVDPTVIRMRQRIAADKFHIDGIALAPASKTIDLGKKIIDFRSESAAKAIRAARQK
jgi:creatinine amidohydrolase/Fe(II)-dependent formamide hydrolase-like protein